MNCTVCGSVIPDGQTNCPVCGAPIQAAAPQQPMGGVAPMQQPVAPQPIQPGQPIGGPQPIQPGQPMGGPQPMQPQQPVYGQPMQPQQPMGGYAMPAAMGTGKIGISDIIVLVGAFFLLLSPFMSWCTVSAFGMKVSENLWKMGGGLYVLSSLIFLVVAAALALMRLANFIPALQPVKQLLAKVPVPDLVVPGVAFLFHLISFLAIKGEISKNSLGGLAHMGAGWLIGLLAIIVAICPAVLKLVGINLDEKIKL